MLFLNKIFKTSSALLKYAQTQRIPSTFVRCATTTDVIDIKSNKVKNFLESLRHEFYELRVNAAGNSVSYARLKQLNGVVGKWEHMSVLQKNLISAQDIAHEKDEDMRKLMEDENKVYTELMHKCEQELLQELLKLADATSYNSTIFEVKAGAGGQEAMLFAKELYDMYLNYFEYKDWEYEIIDAELTDLGGLRHACVEINDAEAYSSLRAEGGVHRVQRVPTTERSGRMHTSTASIAVIPRSSEVDIILNESDLKIETKRASGAGGQHVNTTDSAVRVVHLPTGIAVECQTDRSQLKNRELALKRLRARLLQNQLERVESVQQAARKSQQGTLNRNEKIRTYNFVQDRVTDHRLVGGTVHNLVEYMKGGDQLNSLIERLLVEQRKQQLLEMLDNCKVEEKNLETNKN